MPFMRLVGGRHRRARRGPGLGGVVRPPPEKFPMDAEKRPRTVHQRKKKKKSSGKLLTFGIYVYIFVYTTIRGDVAGIKKAGKLWNL